MTLYQFLIENKNIIKTLQGAGMLPCKVTNHLEIYNDILNTQKQGKSITDSYYEVADKRRISYRTIVTIAVQMKAEI